MLIDFSPVSRKEKRLIDIAQSLTIDDLRAATHAHLDEILSIIQDADDAQLTFDPYDPKAVDPDARPGEEHIGWSLAHLVLHVTASMEEGAAHSSVLARGIPIAMRLRYEPDWKTIITRAQVLQRIAECRRMCLAYLDTWPDSPNFTVEREISEGYKAAVGPLNAPAAYLSGLRHCSNHFDQFRDVAVQARAASAQRA